ncbi:MAG: nucleotidyltransferase family protein [bacterium]
MISDSEKIAILAGLADLRSDAETLARFADSARGRWPSLTALADENHILPFIAKNFVKNGLLELLPTKQRDEFSRLPRETAARNMLFSDAAGEILFAAASRGVDVLPVKGVSLLDRVYQHDERQLSDIDFFFRHPQLHEIKNLMSELGYEEEESCLPADFSDDFSGEIKFTARRAGAAIDVEFHWDPSPSPALKKTFEFTPDTLWSLCAGKDGRISLGPEGEFLYHIFHLAIRHSCSRLQWFLDLERLAAVSPPDWKKLNELFIASRMTLAARYVFRFMERFLNTQFPVAVQQLTRPGGERPDLTDQLIAASIAGRRRVKQSGAIPILLSENKAAFFFSYVFPPAEFISRRYPNIPTPIAYFFRPMDIAGKIIKTGFKR